MNSQAPQQVRRKADVEAGITSACGCQQNLHVSCLLRNAEKPTDDC